MVKFKDLSNGSQENRGVREVIFANGDTITVFEPDKQDIDKVFALQEKYIDEENPEKLSLTGKDIIELFGILTDVEGLDELTEEEVNEVIDNPSIALLQAQNVIEGIVTEVYKMVILSLKNHILETELNMESARTTSEIMEKTLKLAQRNGQSKEYAKKVEKAKKKVVSLQQKQKENEEKEATEEQPVEKKEVKQIDNHSTVLGQFRNVFGDTEDE